VRCQATAAQPQKQQDKHLIVGLPDISQLSPQLQQEWHPDNNAVLGGIKIKPHSGMMIKWSCPNCPAGCPHIWQAKVYSRTRGTKCPYCQGKSLCQHNSLATKAPRQTRYWNHDKNVKTPEQTLAGTNFSAEWKCPICSHEWQGQVAQRARYDYGCPRCKRIESVGNKNTQPTFEAAKHPLLLDWDYERNPKSGIYPQTTTLGSKKAVHWVCHNCPKGKPHLYQMTPNDRTNRQRAGCPYCAGKQACKCNSLEAHAPTLCSEWDSAKNTLTPADVTAQSHQVVWWKNSLRGSWQQRIKDRTKLQKMPT